MAMASSLPLLVPRPPKPTTPHIYPRKAGRLAPLHAASCCNPAAAAATTGGGGFIGAKDWILLAWYLMVLDKHPVATKLVTSVVQTLAGDPICQVLAANFVALAWNVILSFKAHKGVIVR